MQRHAVTSQFIPSPSRTNDEIRIESPQRIFPGQGRRNEPLHPFPSRLPVVQGTHPRPLEETPHGDPKDELGRGEARR